MINLRIVLIIYLRIGMKYPSSKSKPVARAKTSMKIYSIFERIRMKVAVRKVKICPKMMSMIPSNKSISNSSRNLFYNQYKKIDSLNNLLHSLKPNWKNPSKSSILLNNKSKDQILGQIYRFRLCHWVLIDIRLTKDMINLHIRNQMKALHIRSLIKVSSMRINSKMLQKKWEFQKYLTFLLESAKK